MIFDLIMAAAGAQPVVPVWTPAQLFQNGEIGGWLDSSDLSTLFQDAAGTIPVTAGGQPVGLWKNKITGQPLDSALNLKQATSAARPLLINTAGKFSIRYDGVDDQLQGTDGGSMANSGFTCCVGQKKSVNQSGYTYVFAQASTLTVSISNVSDGTVIASGCTDSVYSSNVISLTNWNIITWYARSGSVPSVGVPLTVELNGVTTTTGTQTPGDSRLGSLFRAVGTVNQACDINQVVFINRVLTSTERSQLIAFVSGKQ